MSDRLTLPAAAAGSPSFVDRYPFVLPLLTLIMATGSVVYIEPAPYDLMLIGLMGLTLMLGLRIPAGIGPLAIVLGIFLVANAVAAIFALEPGNTLRSLFVRCYMVAAFLWLTCIIRDAPTRVLRALWIGYLVAAVIAAVAGAVGYYDLGGPERLVDRGRVQGFFKDPNVYGPFLVPAMIYSLAGMQTGRGIALVRHSALFGLMALGNLLGFSRGAWLNAIVSVGAYFLLQALVQRNPVQRRRLMLVVLAMALGSALALGGASMSEEFRITLEKRARLVQDYDKGELGRFANQLRIVRTALSNPLGIGPGETPQAYWFDLAPHNLFLHVLVEAGWIGGLAYWVFLLLTLRAGFQLIRGSTALQNLHVAAFACVIGTLTQSLFIDSTHWRHMYLLFAMIWGPLLALAGPSRRESG